MCTAAERQYALEVWRLLDITSSIIPHEQRKQRIVNVTNNRKKGLLKSLGLKGEPKRAGVEEMGEHQAH